MFNEMFDTAALYIDQIYLSNAALVLVVVLLLALVVLLLYGIPRAIRKARG